MQNNPTFYAPGHAALAEIWRRFPMAGLDVIGLVIEVSDRGEPTQREAAISFMRENQWTEKVNGKIHYSSHNSSDSIRS